MKKLIVLLLIAVAFASCQRKRCYVCTFNQMIPKYDTTVCGMDDKDIEKFIGQYTPPGYTNYITCKVK